MQQPPIIAPRALIPGARRFPHRHLIGIAGLQPHEILFLLDEAEQWVDAQPQPQPSTTTGSPA